MLRSYDAVKDFVAVHRTRLVSADHGGQRIITIKSVADLVSYAKANPDKMNYASSSASFQLVTELFKQKTGAPMQVIPYKSANKSVLAVISAQVTTTIADAGPVVSQVKAGTVRALAVAAPMRMEDLPDVPTLKEAGADVDAVLWSGSCRRTPAIVSKLLRERIDADRQIARRDRAPQAARYRHRRQFIERIREILASTSRGGPRSPGPAISGSSSPNSFQRGEISPTMTVAGRRGDHNVEDQRTEPEIEHVAGAAKVDHLASGFRPLLHRPRPPADAGRQPSSRPSARNQRVNNPNTSAGKVCKKSTGRQSNCRSSAY